VGPLVGGVIWSWSIQLKDFDARNYILYFIMMILTIGNYAWSRRLQPYLNTGFAERHTITDSFATSSPSAFSPSYSDKEAIDLDRLKRSATASPTFAH
jgi:hypothetical protein